MADYLILTINPGSTSDEIALFRGNNLVFHKVVRYSVEDLADYTGKKVTSQYELRKDLVIKTLEEYKVNPKDLDAIIGRGGLIKPVSSGTYKVTEPLMRDLHAGLMGDHPSNLGGLIANKVAELANKPAFIADPVVVDEMSNLARYSGMPENPRVSIFHALNQKRVARMAAAQLGKKYEECNFIVMHAGGGLSCGAHFQGRVVDVNNALDGDGAFTPQRSGGVPAGGLAKMCYSGQYSYEEMKLKFKGKGGLVAYTGTSDALIVQDFVKGKELAPEKRKQLFPDLTREQAKEIYEAMGYQMAKDIAGYAAVLFGKVDAIVFTGGLAYDKELLIPWLKERIGWIAPLIIIPGGDEMAALRDAATRALSGEDEAKIYT